MRHRRLVVLLAVVGLLAACTSGATETPAATQQPTSAATAAPAAPTPTPNPFAGKTIKATKSGDHAFDDVSLGHWIQSLKDKYDITVDLTGVDSADTSFRATISGAGDMSVAMNLTGVVHLVQESGTDVKLIASDTYGSDYQIVSKADVTVDNLAGKIEGISAPGDASELVSHLCLNNQGFDYGSLQIVRIGGTSARVAALLAGQIDIGAAHVADARAAVAKSNGALKILLDCGVVVGNYPVTGMVVTGDWLKANHDLAQVVVNEYVEAMRWAASNKDPYIEFSKTWVPDSPPELASDAYDYFKQVGFWPVNGGIDLPSLEIYLSYASQTGVLVGKIPTTDKWVDDSLVNNYLAANGTQ
jgi:ABC-type nitrate/sulfonate/bicarbonate transport system substrate-binding protein